MGMRNLVRSKFVVFLVVYFALFWPIYAENATNNTHGNNTLFSRRKNLTKIEHESCEWRDIRPTYSVVAAVISAFLILDGGILFTVGKFKRERYICLA